MNIILWQCCMYIYVTNIYCDVICIYVTNILWCFMYILCDKYIFWWCYMYTCTYVTNIIILWCYMYIYEKYLLWWCCMYIMYILTRRKHSFTNFQAPPNAVDFLWSCDKVYHKQEVNFLLYFLGQIVTWQYNCNLLD